MWFCPQCGHKNEDSDFFCPECGSKNPRQEINECDYVNQTADNYAYSGGSSTLEYAMSDCAEIKAKKIGLQCKNKLLIAVVAAVFALAVAVCVLLLTGIGYKLLAAVTGNEESAYKFYSKYIEKEKNPDEEDYLKAAEYAVAARNFDAAEDYIEESGMSVKKGKAFLNEARITLAEEAMDKKQWADAVEYLKDLADDKDAADMLSESAINLAEEAIDEKDWEIAVEYLTYADEHDAAPLKKECSYELGKIAMEGKRWKEAAEYYDMSDEADSKALADECKYNYAIELRTAGEWQTAADVLEGVEFNDSAELYSDSMMHVKSDWAFLQDLEKGVEAYLAGDLSSPENRKAALESEYEYISQYEDAEFYDDSIAGIASGIIDSVDTQISYCSQVIADKIWLRAYQKNIWSNLVNETGYLNTLYTDYRFMKDNASFKSVFVDGKEKLEYQNKVLKAFDTSFYNYRSTKGSSGYAGSGKQLIYYINDTGYELNDVSFYFFCYNSSDVLTETTEVHAALPIGEKTSIKFNATVGVSKYWQWDWYINFD